MKGTILLLIPQPCRGLKWCSDGSISNKSLPPPSALSNAHLCGTHPVHSLISHWRISFTLFCLHMCRNTTSCSLLILPLQDFLCLPLLLTFSCFLEDDCEEPVVLHVRTRQNYNASQLAKAVDLCWGSGSTLWLWIYVAAVDLLRGNDRTSRLLRQRQWIYAGAVDLRWGSGPDIQTSRTRATKIVGSTC